MDAMYYAEKIVKKLTEAGHIAFFAGGWVRDYLLGHSSADIDIATDADPQKILFLFPSTILVGIAFGVVIVSIHGHQFEVATFRHDCGYTNGRKPDRIEFTNAKEDAMRRDFTINGMFYDPLSGKIYDYVQGAQDLELKIIRAIGDADKRFSEDRLRMIRAVRFANRLNFSIEVNTAAAIQKHAHTLFPAVAKERVWMELKKMSEMPRFGQALMQLHHLNLLQEIFPPLKREALENMQRLVQPFALFPLSTPLILYLYELFSKSLALKELIDIFNTFHVSNQEIDWLVAQVNAQPYLLKKAGLERWQWAYFYAEKESSMLIKIQAAKLSEEKRAFFLNEHQNRCGALSTHIERLVQRKPLVTAALLRIEGVMPGVLMGQLLKAAERLTIDHDLQDPLLAIQLLKKMPIWPQEIDA